MTTAKYIAHRQLKKNVRNCIYGIYEKHEFTVSISLLTQLTQILQTDTFICDDLIVFS